MPKQFRLESLTIDRVDLVDDGANPDAAILLYKRNDKGDDMADEDKVDKAGRAISAARMARLKSLREELATLISEAEGGDMKDDKDKEDKVDKTAVPPAEDPVVKAKFEEFQKKIDDLEKANAESKKQADEAIAKAAAETERRERAEFAKRAEGLDKVPGTVEDKGNLLYTLSKKLTADEFAAVDKMLSAANEALAKGEVFAERGKPGKLGGGTAYQKMVTLAREQVAKGTFKTEADAISQVAVDHPDLYAEHVAEMRAAAKAN